MGLRAAALASSPPQLLLLLLLRCWVISPAHSAPATLSLSLSFSCAFCKAFHLWPTTGFGYGTSICGSLQPHHLIERREPAAYFLMMSWLSLRDDRFPGICGIYLKLSKENRNIASCNRLGMETLGFRPIVPKNLPGHCTICFNEE